MNLFTRWRDAWRWRRIIRETWPTWELFQLALQAEKRSSYVQGFEDGRVRRTAEMSMKLRKVANMCEMGGHTSRARMLNALAGEFEASANGNRPN